MSQSRKRKADGQLTLSSFLAKRKPSDVPQENDAYELSEAAPVSNESEVVAAASCPDTDVGAQETVTRRSDVGSDFAVANNEWARLPSSLPKEDKFALITGHFEPDSKYQFAPHADNEGKQRKFRLQWLRDYQWLRYSPKCNGGFCLPCLLFRAGADQGQLTARPLTNYKKATTLLQKHNEQQSHQDSVIKYQQFRSVAVGSNPDIADQLETISQKQQRENDEKLKSLVDCIVFCGKQNISLRGHRNEKVGQTETLTSESDTDGAEIALFDKEAGNPGNFIALLEFRAQAGDNAVLRDFHLHAGGTGGHRVNYLSPKIQNELIDCCGDTIRDNILAGARKAEYLVFLLMKPRTLGTSNKCLLFCALSRTSRRGKSSSGLIF